MSLRGFRKAGHTPTLLSAFLYFDVSFMVWVILGPLGPFIGEALKLTTAQKGMLTAVPLLGGSFFRLILGFSTERIGGRKTGLIGLGLSLIPLLLGWQVASSFGQFLALGLLLGIAGASFAAALPLASGWYPPEYQGLAMGIAGAGNSGTLMATLFAPRLAMRFGWHSVFGFAMIPVAIVWLLFALLAKDAPRKVQRKTWNDYAAVLRISDTGWFCFIYSLTFGGFVGLASFLTIFFRDQYHLTKVQSGDLTTIVVLFGSFLRPVGGTLSGSRRRLQDAAGDAGGRGDLPCRSRHIAGGLCGGGSAGDCDGDARDGQRRGIPTRPAALSGSRRVADWIGGRGRRPRRLHAAERARSIEGQHRQFRFGLLRVRRSDGAGLRGPALSRPCVAATMECRLGDSRRSAEEFRNGC